MYGKGALDCVADEVRLLLLPLPLLLPLLLLLLLLLLMAIVLPVTASIFDCLRRVRVFRRRPACTRQQSAPLYPTTVTCISLMAP